MTSGALRREHVRRAPGRAPASAGRGGSDPASGADPIGGADAGLRYRRIASSLQAAIAAGAYPVGSSLPTEAQLCAEHRVSRHTVREALKRLADLGLVERRQGAGTRVIALAPKAAYVHTLGSLVELFQYTRDTRLDIAQMGVAPLEPEEAELVPAPAGSRWLKVTGLRWRAEGDEAISWSMIFVHGRFARLLEDLRQTSGPIYALIEARSGEVVAEALQEISGGPMPRAAASALKLRAGTPAIRVLRRYLDASGGTMLTSINWHPAESFTYAMRLRRDLGGEP